MISLSEQSELVGVGESGLKKAGARGIPEAGGEAQCGQLAPGAILSGVI